MADGTIGLWTVPLAVFGGAIRVSTPFLFVSLGECITERSARINLGLDGTLVPVAMGVGPIVEWAFRGGGWGLLIRTAGESWDAGKAMGYSVLVIRLRATMVGGFLAGIGGSFLSLFYPGSWNEGLSSGQGITAVALVIFARWDPMLCLWASLAFGGAAALGPALQSVGVTSGYHLVNAAPYILTLAIMIITCSPKRTLTRASAHRSLTR